MTDMMNLHGMQRDDHQGGIDPLLTGSDPVTPLKNERHEQIGVVTDVSGGGARIRVQGKRLRELAIDPDPSVAMSGQVGSQVKLESGKKWLLANVRNLRVDDEGNDTVTAEIDFLGEGDEDP